MGAKTKANLPAPSASVGNILQQAQAVAAASQTRQIQSRPGIGSVTQAVSNNDMILHPRSAGATGVTGSTDTKLHKLHHLPQDIAWYNQFIGAIDDILAKKELSIEQLEWVPAFIHPLAELVDFGGKKSTYEGFKNSFWRCIHRVDSLIFQDYEFMKQLRQMLCEARQMLHPDVGKTWDEIAKEEAEMQADIEQGDRPSMYEAMDQLLSEVKL